MIWLSVSPPVHSFRRLYITCLCTLFDMSLNDRWIYANPWDQILSTISSHASVLQWLFVLDYTVLINAIRTAAPRAWSRISSCAQFHKLSAREEWWRGPSITSALIETKILRVWLCCGRKLWTSASSITPCFVMNEWHHTAARHRHDSVISYQIMMFTPHRATDGEMWPYCTR